MTYLQAVAYLESLANYEQIHDAEAIRSVRLSRMRHLCQRLGDPQRWFRSILVAGTNGKGSLCAMLYAMLRESSLRVGLYTSPHLEHLRERIRVGGGGEGTEERTFGDDWIEKSQVAALVEQLQPAVEALRKTPDGPPTHFEALTALALLSFQRRRVDVAVLEVGLGGRLDATNIVDQAISLIGPIDVDHADILGATPVAIAKEKAGIIKPHQTVITVPQSAEVLEILRAACEAQGVELLVCGEAFTVDVQRHGLTGLHISLGGLRGRYDAVHVPLLGRHQAQHAAVAVAAMEVLSSTGIPHSMVERGFSKLEWPGRLEIVHESPTILMDGAHNPHAARALAETLQELWGDRRMHFLVGMSADKPVEAIGEILGRMSISITCTQSRHPRALDPNILAKRLSAYGPVGHVFNDAADAYTYLLNTTAPSDMIVVTGSLFFVGELRWALRRAHVRTRRKTVAA